VNSRKKKHISPLKLSIFHGEKSSSTWGPLGSLPPFRPHPSCSFFSGQALRTTATSCSWHPGVLKPMGQWCGSIKNVFSPLCLLPNTHTFVQILILRSKFLHVFGQHGAPEHLGPKLVGYGFSQLVIGDGPAASGLPEDLGEKCCCYWGPIRVCLKMGYTPNYSHLVGIMITIGCRGTLFSDKPILEDRKAPTDSTVVREANL